MELNSNAVIVIVIILLCVLVLTSAMLKVLRSLDTIVHCMKNSSISQDEIPLKEASTKTKNTKRSGFVKLKGMIVPTILVVIAFCVNNIEIIKNFISPDPIEETNKKLAQIVDQTQPLTKIELPDSLEQTLEVKIIRKAQAKLLYFNLSLQMLKRTPNSLDGAGTDYTIVSYYTSLVKEFKRTNEAFTQVVESVSLVPSVYSYLNENSLLYYYEFQKEYNNKQNDALKALTEVYSKESVNRKKFQATMLDLAEASYLNTDMQMELIRQFDIATNLALLDIKNKNLK